MTDPACARERLEALARTLPAAAATLEAGRHLRLAVRGRTFAWLVDDHHGDGRLAVSCKVPPGENAVLAADDPQRFFLPAYLASKGWVALDLGVEPVDWDRVDALVVGSYRLVAPRRLAARV